MNTPQYMPRVMVHPGHRKSVPRTFQEAGAPNTYGHDDVPIGGTRGTADVFPPVTVSSKDAEAYHRAMGYRFQDDPPSAIVYTEFPMWVVQDGKADLLVNNADELAKAQDRGYRPAGQPNPVAFEREHTSPYVAGRVTAEYPKMVDGRVYDPDEEDGGPAQYPKWVGDKVVHSAEEERALLGSASLPDRLALAQQARDRAAAAAKAAADIQKAAEEELAALLGDANEQETEETSVDLPAHASEAAKRGPGRPRKPA